MRAGLVSSKIKHLVTVAQNTLPLLFKQRLKLGDVLQDNGHAHIPGAHGRQYLIEVIGQAHIGKLVHQEVDGNRQAPTVLVVCQPE